MIENMKGFWTGYHEFSLSCVELASQSEVGQSTSFHPRRIFLGESWAW